MQIVKPMESPFWCFSPTSFCSVILPKLSFLCSKNTEQLLVISLSTEGLHPLLVCVLFICGCEHDMCVCTHSGERLFMLVCTFFVQTCTQAMTSGWLEIEVLPRSARSSKVPLKSAISLKWAVLYCQFQRRADHRTLTHFLLPATADHVFPRSAAAQL